jgi:siroheme synthase
VTLVFLMAVARQRDIAAALLARGWRASTPAALLFAASREDAETWVGTIGALGRGQGVIETERPGMIVVGDVVNVREQLGLRDHREFRRKAETAGTERVEALR